MDQATFLLIYAPDPLRRKLMSLSAASSGYQKGGFGFGRGEEPFLNGGFGFGSGEEPFAIKTESLPRTTTVFRPIAPTSTSVENNTAASFLDMYASGERNTRRHFTPYPRDVKQIATWACTLKVHTYPAPDFAKCLPGNRGRTLNCPMRIGFRSCRVNGTVVLHGIGLLARRWTQGAFRTAAVE